MPILDAVNSLIEAQKSEFKGLFSSLITKACPVSNCGKVHPEDQPSNQQGNVSTGNAGMGDNPNNQAQPQITTASSMVQSMGSALKHPVQVNHDAAGVGVTHASMLVHPEWNQDSVKTKIDAHLKSQNWKSGKGESGASGSKTYSSPEGHKIHVAPVGKHLIVSAEDKKGATPTPYVPPPKSAKKSEDAILTLFGEGVLTTLATVHPYIMEK